MTCAYAQGGMESHERRVWRLVAFLGRYGHQPACDCLGLPLTALQMLAEGVAEIMREEADQMKGPSDA